MDLLWIFGLFLLVLFVVAFVFLYDRIRFIEKISESNRKYQLEVNENFASSIHAQNKMNEKYIQSIKGLLERTAKLGEK